MKKTCCSGPATQNSICTPFNTVGAPDGWNVNKSPGSDVSGPCLRAVQGGVTGAEITNGGAGQDLYFLGNPLLKVECPVADSSGGGQGRKALRLVTARRTTTSGTVCGTANYQDTDSGICYQAECC